MYYHIGYRKIFLKNFYFRKIDCQKDFHKYLSKYKLFLQAIHGHFNFVVIEIMVTDSCAVNQFEYSKCISANNRTK